MGQQWNELRQLAQGVEVTTLKRDAVMGGIQGYFKDCQHLDQVVVDMSNCGYILIPRALQFSNTFAASCDATASWSSHRSRPIH